MREDIRLDGWRIQADGAFAEDFMESVFFCGNGRMGVRGYAAGDPSPDPVKHGLFLAGMFDEISPGITDIIHLPTPVWHSVTLNGTQPILEGSVRRTLDMSCGQVVLEYRLRAQDAVLDVVEERIFDPDRPAALFQRLRICSNTASELCIESGVYSASCNCPVPDDQMKQNTQTVQLMLESNPVFEQDSMYCQWHSRTTDLALKQEVHFSVQGTVTESTFFFRQNEASGMCVRSSLKPGIPFVLDKDTNIFTSRDNDPLITSTAGCVPYEDFLQGAKNAWGKRWAVCDVRIEGDPQAECALRYSAYQLMTSFNGRDATVNIGARGLTHSRYKGCYFWDTDLFMMPFFLYTAPASARALMQYRIDCLPQARSYAKKMNSAGARYPWMASYDGSEQCESWDIGASELHITADIAYALNHYMEATNDTEFALAADTVYVETARFWVSRYTMEPGTNQANLLFCKGPDEYCGITTNNLFTNVMVRHNLQLAMQAEKELREKAPKMYADLGLSPAEAENWENLYEGIKIPRDPVTGRLRQDDTFHLLEPVDAASLKCGDEASYHNICFDRLQRYQVIKQADVLLLMTRLPNLFTAEQKLNAWEDFEPKCLHDSTLSFASHALFAAENGLTSSALNYFEKALYLDLKEIMGNTGKEGLHLANLGEVWQAAIFGFAGLHFTNKEPELLPHLPEGWKSISFHFFWKGQLYSAHASADGNTKIQAIS